MPTQVFRNAYLWVNNVDLSGSVQSLSLSYEAASLDETAMGDSSRKMRGGLKSQALDVTFFQKFTCVDATLFSLVGCQTSIDVRSCNACSTDSNPRFQATWLLRSLPPMSGRVGDLLTATVRFEPAGDLSRTVAAT